MNEPKDEPIFLSSDQTPIPGMQRFSHEAMATTFEILVVHDNERLARQAALAAFNEVERLEAELSRFRTNSDIAQINRLAAGEPLILGLDAFECLKISEQLFEQTNGVFDVTIGSLLSCRRDKNGNPRIPTNDELALALSHTGMKNISLNEEEHTICLSESPVLVDLGGIGKGYTVDRMAEILREWTIDCALVSGGFSSILALDAPPEMKGWPVTFSNPSDRRQTLVRLSLENRALGSSGILQGQHIIDPRTGRPVEDKRGAWSCVPDAASADALSTAFMVMNNDEIKRYCCEYPDTAAMIILEGTWKLIDRKEILLFGNWDEPGFTLLI
jgi:thiamine biosynthesis lipoprotein